jgi:hypothetical protein
MNRNFLESNCAPLSMNEHQRTNDFDYQQQQEQTSAEAGAEMQNSLSPVRDYELSSGRNDIPAPWEHRPSPTSRKSIPPSNMGGTPDLVAQHPSPAMGTKDHENRGSSSTAARSFPPFKRYSSPSASFPPLPASVSQAIPIPIPTASESMKKRKDSELQLKEDEAMADYRDFCMYCRIVNGIRERRSWTDLPSAISSADNDTINHIIRTRHQPVQEPCSYCGEVGETTSLLERFVMTSPPQKPKAIIRHAENFPVAPTLERRIVLGNHRVESTPVGDEDCLFEMDDL